MEKYCIIIDDAYDIESTIEDYRYEASSRGISLNCVHLNPQQEDCLVDIGTAEKPKYTIDIAKVSNLLQSQAYKFKKADIILCDYDLSDDSVNGFEIVRYLRNQLSYKREVILFSANIDRVIKNILSVKNQQEKIQKIRNLAYANIRDICDRGNVKYSMLTIFSNEGSSLENELIKLLHKYEKYTFQNGFPEFRGKLISSIIEEIHHDTKKANRFKIALLEYAVAQMISINDHE